MNREITDFLREQLGDGLVEQENARANRTLLLRTWFEDFQVGLSIQKSKRRGIWNSLIDIGVRIPSVERFYGEYEIESMRKRGVRNPKPIGWLTFWRPTFSSLELEERGFQVDTIQRDFVQFCDSVTMDPEAFREEVFNLLCEARRPKWATEPGSTFLVIKALVAMTLRDPEIDACDYVEKLLRNEPVIKAYKSNIDRFCIWLRSERHCSQSN